ncbi:MAG: PA14 domain-containing protein [Sedimentisphaerales bacterium]
MCQKQICLLSSIVILGSVLAVPAHAELVGWWKFDEGSGTIAFDSSGNGNDGTLEGGPAWVEGKLGGALQFDGAGTRVVAPHIPLDSRSFTVTMWVNAVLYTGEQVVFSTGLTGADNTDMHFRLGGPGSGNVPAGGVRMGFYNNDLDTPGGLIQENTWYHLAFWYDFENLNRRIYIDGVMEAEATANPYLGTTGNTVIGAWGTGQWFRGMIDDVQVYNEALTDTDILAAMQGLEGYPYASSPNPPDGAIHADTWVTLSWRAGDFAVSHDVYLSDSFDDVNGGAPDAFQGNQGSTYYVAGFPGFAYPDGLVPGTTYYWRIDEVNDADPNSPWKGKIWSFTVPPKKAYDPVPADGAKFIDAAATKLSWAAGFGAKLHTVYFGDDFDTIANATGGTPLGVTNYNPGPLETTKTYYWRVDEFDGAQTYTGDVWSFTTAKEGGGVRGDYYRGMNFNTLVLTRIDPQIDFNWGDPGSPDPLVPVDQFSARWTGEVEAGFTETYTFYTASDDGVRLWIDGRQLVDNWTDHASTENSGTIDLVAGNTYSLVMEYYENGGGAVAELRWSSPHTPKQLIPQAALAPPVKASGPIPANGSTGASLSPILTWNPGDYAASHEVYFGTDRDAVANATKASPEFKATKALGDESYDPGQLAWYTTYYWRVDEVNNVNPDSPWVGNLWSFTTGDFLLVDDFETYTDDDTAGEAVWQHWIDGFGIADNGSQVGYLLPPYAEQTIVHSGHQSMPLFYSNVDGVTNSQGEMTLTWPRDWTEQEVAELSLWFRGIPGSTGSFVEAPAGTFTMTGSGADIWNDADEFHYAYKALTGAGSIVARVESITNTNTWAKAGVMIRETLDPGSKHATMVVTPGQGISFQRRPVADSGSADTTTGGIIAPYWVKIDRDIAGNFSAYGSPDGTTWTLQGTPENISMGSNVYIGLAVTSHDAALTCQAVFSNVTTTGNVSGQWADQDIGITSNAAEPLYVAVSNASGAPAVVANDDPAAAQIDTWTEWRIPLQAFADQGINLRDVDRIAIGLGSESGIVSAGGSGTVYIDDIRLYRATPEPEPQP